MNLTNVIVEKPDAKNNATTAAKNDIALIKKKGVVVKKDYVLNDLEALKKKLDNEFLTPGIQIASDSVGGKIPLSK